MKILEAISRVDDLIPNTYTQVEKIRWLSHVDGVVRSTIIDLYEGAPLEPFKGYGENVSGDTVLVVPYPYDELYLRWLEAQIHYYNGEMDRYNNAIILYKDLLEGFREYFHGNNKPLSRCGNRFRF